MYQLTLFSTPAILALVVCVVSLWRIRQYSNVAGTRGMMMLLISTTVWSACQLAGTIVIDFPTKQALGQFAYLGIAAAPVFWFSFCITYSLGTDHASRPLMTIVAILPTMAILLAFTNQYHGLVWQSSLPTLEGDYLGIAYTYGIWFKLNAAYSFGLILAGTSIIAFTLAQTGSHRRPLFAVIAAPAVVIALNALYLSPSNPVPGFDLTATSFALATLILNHWVLGHGMLSTTKIVRERVLEQLREGIVVVNSGGLIIDANPKAMEILDLNRDVTFNQPFQNLVNNLSLVELVTSHRSSTHVGIKDRSYEVTVSKFEPDEEASDAVLVFRDVTERRKAEHELQRATSDLRRAAHTDALTGLFNRRIFMERLEEEAERVSRHGSALSVLLFDLDHFKKVNDTYGHDAGDSVLKGVAEVAEDVKRITDVVARTGGEEFALVLPETGHDGAKKLANRLRQAIEEMEVTTSTGQRIKITASIGVATVSKIGKNVDVFLRDADLALYRAKDTGRNRVCFAGVI